MPSKTETWYRLPVDEVIDTLESARAGLSKEEAAARRDQYGPNTIRTEQKVSAWKVLLDQFTNPLIYVLLVALVVTLAIQHWADSTVIGLVLLINATVGFFQEYRAETAVQSLMKMVSPKARVRRGGTEQKVDGDDLVPGDFVLLGEGDMVPADLRIVESKSLQVNEAALTGESVPVSKSSAAIEDADGNIPPADQQNMAFMGTAVTAGHAEGVVTATGRETQLGEIAEGVREAADVQTPLQRRMDRLAKGIAAIVLLVATAAFGVGLLMGRDTTEMFLLAVALAVSAIPEGLPVVVTVALAIGVRRMASRNAVIRHLPAVETLGSTTTIVTDKTGTLTQNRMTVQKIAAGGTRFELSGNAFSRHGSIERDGETVDVTDSPPLYETLLAGLLNNSATLEAPDNERHPEELEHTGREDGEQETEDESNNEQTEEKNGQDFRAVGDPMEVALLISAAKAGMSRNELSEQYPQIDEVPFQTERQFSATVHRVPEDEEGPLVLIKGAPERILDMCQRCKNLDGEESDLNHDEMSEQNEQLASEGLRVLAMAIGRGEDAADSIKGDQPSGMTFVGMQGLVDPPRPEAIEAIDNCHESRIRVVMVTGDHARTAAAIAREVHIDRPLSGGTKKERDDQAADAAAELPEAHTGQQLSELSDDEIDAILQRSNVYARVKPKDKMRIVDRFKAQRQVVAVTGDGVNDAPALKSAHIGAAMGQTGTDVAKEASDMVITDDNFASVYSAVEEGRTAFRNIRMATFFLLSTAVAEVVAILTSLVLRWPLPLLPAQILWVNVVTNGIADVALAFEPGERALYRRSPRPPSEGVLDRTLIERLIVVGVWLAAGTLGVFYWVASQMNLNLARVAALTTLVLFQTVHVFNCRSEEVSIFKKSLFSNKVLLLGVLTTVVHVAALHIPWTQQLLDFQPLPWQVWGVTIGVAATAIMVNEFHKRFRPRDKVNQETWPVSWFSRQTRDQDAAAITLSREELDDRLSTIEQNLQANRELLDSALNRRHEKQVGDDD